LQCLGDFLDLQKALAAMFEKKRKYNYMMQTEPNLYRIYILKKEIKASGIISSLDKDHMEIRK
jgi:hypothetical protein